MTANSNARYALYFAPHAGSAWAQFGTEWFARVAEAPRRYGFHATLKAPFRLAGSTTLGALVDAVGDYCVGLREFALPALKVTLLDDFLALVPATADRSIELIAAECVMRFDRFRAPLAESDLARRRPERLNPPELQMLQNWGYPYVLDLFRFHMSLTGPLGQADPKRAATLSADAAKAIAPLGPPVFDAICVFEEPHAGADFHLLRRFPFAYPAHLR